ncbi:hypothetical protein EYF80_014322 [Liparis tanakae]|uniref:Uncharacterized protein n=1 Tax=Liparis tanakae TaxID=230148 RepID=A0A4Z2IC75_9TELE|nr:hypothetical protein EYF80_014322 [Liparis tanakae]
MHHVEVPDLGEEASHGFTVVLPEPDGSGPAHNNNNNNNTLLSRFTHPELVGPELVDVGSLSGNRLVPEAELQQQLVPAGHQHLAALLPVGGELLPTDGQRSIRGAGTGRPHANETEPGRGPYRILLELVHHLRQRRVAASVTPQVDWGTGGDTN